MIQSRLHTMVLSSFWSVLRGVPTPWRMRFRPQPYQAITPPPQHKRKDEMKTYLEGRVENKKKKRKTTKRRIPRSCNAPPGNEIKAFPDFQGIKSSGTLPVACADTFEDQILVATLLCYFIITCRGIDVYSKLHRTEGEASITKKLSCVPTASCTGKITHRNDEHAFI